MKKRYIAAIIIVLASILVTPSSITHAYNFRGYFAIGGEWLVIPLGIIMALLLLEAAKGWDTLKELRKQGQQTPESEE